MSARSRALNDLAAHFEMLRVGDELSHGCEEDAPPIHNDWQMWANAADVARDQAAQETWTVRIKGWLRR